MSSLFHGLICAFKFYATLGHFVGDFASMAKQTFLPLSELEDGIYTEQSCDTATEQRTLTPQLPPPPNRNGLLFI